MDYIETNVKSGGFRHLGRLPHKIVRREKPGFALPQMLGVNGADFPDVLDTVVFDQPLETVRVFDSSGNPVAGKRSNPKWRIGKSNLRVVHCPEVSQGLKVLVLRDSFTTAMSPYLNSSFARTTYAAWARQPGREMVSLIDRQKPDLVLFIMVQRCLKLRHLKHWAWASGDGVLPRERFEKSERIVLNENAEAFLKRLRKRSGARPVKLTEQGVAVGAVKTILYLDLRSVDAGADDTCVIRLDMTAPKAGQCTIVFSTGKKKKAPGPGLRPCPLFAGDNTLYFEIPTAAMKGQMQINIRGGQGTCFIKRFEIRSGSSSAQGSGPATADQ